MSIINLPQDIFDYIFLNYLSLKDITKLSLTCKDLNIENILTLNTINIYQDAKHGWNFCVNNGKVIPLEILIRSNLPKPFHYDKENNNYYNQINRMMGININNIVDKLDIYLNSSGYLNYINSAEVKFFNILNVEKGFYDFSKYDILILGFDPYQYDNMLFHQWIINKDFKNMVWLYDLDKTKIDIIGDLELSYYLACKYGHHELMKYLHKPKYDQIK